MTSVFSSVCISRNSWWGVPSYFSNIDPRPISDQYLFSKSKAVPLRGFLFANSTLSIILLTDKSRGKGVFLGLHGGGGGGLLPCSPNSDPIPHFRSVKARLNEDVFEANVLCFFIDSFKRCYVR